MEELRYALMGNGRQCAVVDGQKINKQFVEVLKLMTCYTVRFLYFHTILYCRSFPEYVTLKEIPRDPGPIIKELYYCTESKTRPATKCADSILKFVCNNTVQVVCQKGMVI